MKANYSTYITRAVILLLVFFFISMAVIAQHKPMNHEEQKEVAFPKADQFSNTKLSNKLIPAYNSTF